MQSNMVTVPKPVRAFTLIELLVCIGIIAMLAAILYPVLANAKIEGHRVADINNLRQLGMGESIYSSDYDAAKVYSTVPLVRSGIATNKICVSSFDPLKNGYANYYRMELSQGKPSKNPYIGYPPTLYKDSYVSIQDSG